MQLETSGVKSLEHLQITALAALDVRVLMTIYLAQVVRISQEVLFEVQPDGGTHFSTSSLATKRMKAVFL